MKILGICGSFRKNSYNHYALLAAGEAMPAGMTLSVTTFDDVPTRILICFCNE
ncbi:MAG: NAD(P)H-dependent oxidoreductase [Pseudomonadota bacterium]